MVCSTEKQGVSGGRLHHIPAVVYDLTSFFTFTLHGHTKGGGGVRVGLFAMTGAISSQPGKRREDLGNLVCFIYLFSSSASYM